MDTLLYSMLISVNITDTLIPSNIYKIIIFKILEFQTSDIGFCNISSTTISKHCKIIYF